MLLWPYSTEWKTVERTILFFLICMLLTRGFIENKHFSSTSHLYFNLWNHLVWQKALLIYSLLIKLQFLENVLDIHYFCYYKCPEQLTFKKMKWFWKLIQSLILSPNMRRWCKIFFFVIDRYVRQLRPTDRQNHDNLL